MQAWSSTPSGAWLLWAQRLAGVRGAHRPMPADEREAVEAWHNHLVDLCAITVRDMRKSFAKDAALGRAPQAVLSNAISSIDELDTQRVSAPKAHFLGGCLSFARHQCLNLPCAHPNLKNTWLSGV